MFIEIVLGIIVAVILIYLWVLYLSWADRYNNVYATYKVLPISVSVEDKEMLDNWGWALPSEVITDTYKYAYFWGLYYYNLFSIKFE
jgi:hypothetical protein